MSTTTIQDEINQVYSTQESNQFGTQRYELMFEPGTYDVTVPVGFYTEVVGLGQSPTQTVITGGGIYTDASWNGGNATENFWRDVENITIDPSSGSTEWAASQAAPLRRVDIVGNAVLADNNGWASGGFIGDSVVTGQVNSETQQQYISRNDQYGSWTSSSWNMVFVGDIGVPAQSFPSPPDTTVSSTPAIAEKPYPYIDSSGNWDVFVPGDRTNAQGTSWSGGNTPGTSLPISDFYIATPSSTVVQISGLGGELPVDRAHSDAGVVRDVVERRPHAPVAEHLARRGQDAPQVALGVLAQSRRRRLPGVHSHSTILATRSGGKHIRGDEMIRPSAGP